MEILHDREKSKFYVERNGEEARLKYNIIDNSTMDLLETFVPEEFRGEGLAGKIVEETLTFAEENNFKIISTCSFVQKYLERHKEYEHLLSK